MSRLSDYLRRRKIDPMHHTRRALARYVVKRGFEIGDCTYGKPEILPWGNARLSVGSYCSIAQGVKIFLGGNHHIEWVTTFPFKRSPSYPEAHGMAHDPETSRGDVVIGSDVWIGVGAIILSGVTIGHGAVIGAGTVVSRDVPPYAIAAGNPVRVARLRFPDQQVAELLELRWWELKREQIVTLLPLLSGSDVAAFIVACRAIKSEARLAAAGDGTNESVLTSQGWLVNEAGD